ncbi:MAG: HEPN domain-containing protein [Actinomycetota bacterium]|nr:HEPN domain-containing protein [Actinomycetota bacterium]
MAKQAKTRRTSIGPEKLYLSKAEKFLTGAKLLIDEKNWEAAASLGIHAIISSCDASTAKFLSRRYAGTDHQGVLDLLSGLPLADQKELKQIKRRIGQVLAVKTNVEYGDKPVRSGPARQIVAEAERVFAWTQKHVR